MKALPEWRAKAPAGITLKAAQGSDAVTAALALPTDSSVAARPRADMINFITPAAQARWLGPGVAFYSPQRVEQIFRQALAGDLQSEWEMFDMMKATWPRLSKNINQLTQAVQEADLKVKPWQAQDEEPTDEAKERQKLVVEALAAMSPDPAKDENGYKKTVRDILDGKWNAHSVLETAWQVVERNSGGMMVAPRCTRWVHPAWYGYEHGAADADLKLKTGQWNEYMSTVTAGPSTFVDFPENKFIFAIDKSKTGHPLGSAMLHVLGFAWAASNFAGEWALNFAQLFAQPFRWATYDPNMTPGDQAKLASMLANMGSNAWAMFPAGTEMEFKEAMKSAGDSPQFALMEWADKVCDLTLLHQTLSSDVSKDGGARAQGEVHERILGKAELACANFVCETLNQLVRAIVYLNYNDYRLMPTMSPPLEEEDESGELAGTLKTLADAGYEITDEELPAIGKRLGFNIQRKALPAAPDDKEEPDPDKTDLEAKHAPENNDAVNELAAKHAAALAGALKTSYLPVVQMIRDSKTPAEAQRAIRAYFADWRPSEIIDVLTPPLQLAAAHGAIEGKADSK